MALSWRSVVLSAASNEYPFTIGDDGDFDDPKLWPIDATDVEQLLNYGRDVPISHFLKEFEAIQEDIVSPAAASSGSLFSISEGAHSIKDEPSARHTKEDETDFDYYLSTEDDADVFGEFEETMTAQSDDDEEAARSSGILISTITKSH